ncbi:MAG TPA: hypothetical protein VFI46_03375 [Jiangellaceae bacterium]|nr:hypothetical protein [Jiangellaceae bacterium]
MLQVGASHLVRVPDGRARLAMGPYEGFAVWVLLQRHGYTRYPSVTLSPPGSLDQVASG